jgi:hypothetical protein
MESNLRPSLGPHELSDSMGPSEAIQVPNSVATFGEVFPGGAFLELVRRTGLASPQLLLWDSREQARGDVVQYRGQDYIPRAFHETILRRLNLPTNVGSFGSVRELLAEICKLVHQFSRLPEPLSALVGRCVLATWLVEATPTAPRILIDGPDTIRARRLLQLMHCICRRALWLTALGPADFCSLPSGAGFTLLVSQTILSKKLSNLLDAAIRRDSAIPKGGELRDLFGAQVILRDAGFGDAWPPGSIRIPCMSISEQLPVLDSEQEGRIVEELQPKLLGFRLSEFQAACTTRFDASNFAMALREPAAILAAATPGDVELQMELRGLLYEQTMQIMEENWVDLNTVIIESILFYCREGKMESVYVGEIAKVAEKILEGRGVARKIDPGEAGRRIRNLGFSTEPRDARGVKLRLNDAVCARAQELALQLDVPSVGESQCRHVGNEGKIE